MLARADAIAITCTRCGCKSLYVVVGPHGETEIYCAICDPDKFEDLLQGSPRFNR